MPKSVVEQAAISEQEFLADVKSSLDQIHDSKEPTVLVRENGKEVVILSRKEYESWKETLHLLKSPKDTEEVLVALNRKPEELIRFNNIEELRHELGL